jgi:hypothetical protein
LGVEWAYVSLLVYFFGGEGRRRVKKNRTNTTHYIREYPLDSFVT